METKVVVLNGIDSSFEIEVRKLEELKPGFARVKIKAAAFNRRDYWIYKGQYAGLKFPIVLGSDGSGIVDSIHTVSDDSNHWLGKKVVILPSYNWEHDSNSQPSDFKILGLPDDGTFAEYLDVPIQNLYAMPEHLSFEEAAAFPLAGLTAYRALFKKGELSSGQNLLITGVGGGAATMALQMGVALGAHVWVTSSSESKIEKAISLGAKGGVNYRNEDWDQELLSKIQGFDLIMDSALGDNFPKLIELANPGGKIVFFGGTDGNLPPINGRRIFWKQLEIKGTTMGSAVDFRNFLEFIEKHKIKPVIDEVLPIKKAQEGLLKMSSSSQFGKIILKIED